MVLQSLKFFLVSLFALSISVFSANDHGGTGNHMGGQMGGMGGNHMGNGNNNNNEQDGEFMCSGSYGVCNQCDMMTIHNLLQNRAMIQRDVKDTKTGVETTTWSSDTTVAGWIQTHVAQMHKRLLNDCPIRRWDPLFAAVFANHESLTLDITNQTDGVRVIETGDTDCAVSLIQTHADVVSNFLKYGHDEVMQSHDVPYACLQENGFPDNSRIPSQATSTDPSQTYWPSTASTSDTRVAAEASNPNETKSIAFCRYYISLPRLFGCIFVVSVVSCVG